MDAEKALAIKQLFLVSCREVQGSPRQNVCCCGYFDEFIEGI